MMISVTDKDGKIRWDNLTGEKKVIEIYYLNKLPHISFNIKSLV